MPYDGPDDAGLPDRIKKMPHASRDKWVKVWNNSFKNCRDKDTVGGAGSVEDCEGTAFKFANAAVKEVTCEKCGCDSGMVYRRQADQETAEYNALGGNGQKACANCLFFASPDSCTVVDAYPLPIAPTGISKFWTAVPDYRHEPLEVVIVKDEAKEIHATKPKERKTIMKVIGALKGLLSRETEPEGFRFIKQADGSLRWFAWATNHFRDADNPPEIFESKAHEEFVSHLDKGGRMPEAWLWHTPGTKWGQTDWADYADGFLVCSGVVDEGMEHVAEALSRKKGLGVSHGYNFRYSDEANGIIGWYRTLEISPLPAKAAANPWTGMEVVKKEATEMFSDTKRQFLVDILGEDGVVALESRTEELAKELEALGIEHKDLEEGEPAGETTQMDALADALGKAIKIPTATETAQAVVESEGFKTMATAIAEVKQNADQVPIILVRLKELEKTEDEKIAAAMVAKVIPGKTQAFKASETPENVITKGDKLDDEGPTLDDGWKDRFHAMAVGATQGDGARSS